MSKLTNIKDDLQLKRTRRLQRFSNRSEPYLYLLPTIAIMVLLLIIPIYMVIHYSFFDNVIINKNPIFIGIDNYVKILADSAFWVAVRNTLFFVAVSVVVHLFLGMIFAMLLNTGYLSNKSKALFRVIYALPWMFTASIIAILWKMMMNPNGIINFLLQVTNISSNQIAWLGDRKFALIAVTIINIWAGYPFYMISILAGLQGVSGDLYEASAIDGANMKQQFFRITIPQLQPILISLIMLDFVWTIQQFALIWMTTGGGPINATETISTYIYKQGFSKYQYSQASATAVILLVVCSIIAIFYVRHQRARE